MNFHFKRSCIKEKFNYVVNKLFNLCNSKQLNFMKIRLYFYIFSVTRKASNMINHFNNNIFVYFHKKICYLEKHQTKSSSYN